MTQQAKINSLEETVRSILKEEAEDKEMSIAEMEQRKAENLIVHHDEIHARAPRTWIVSSKQKLQTKGMYVCMYVCMFVMLLYFDYFFEFSSCFH